MDQNMSFGSMSPQMGGMDALNEAIKRRSTGQAAPTDQVTPAAPTFDPAMAGGAQPQGSPTAGMGAPSPDMGQGQPNPEAQLIISALSNRLKSDSKIKERQTGI